MNDYKDYLNIAIFQESKPVTYKSLARSLGIHINTAKQVLYEFSIQNQAKVHAVYCITGTSIKNDQFSIQLVETSELEDTKKSYKQITGVHVYSVTSFEPTDFSLLYSACKDIPKLSLEDRIKSGVLKNDNATLKKPSASKPLESKAAVAESKPFAKASTAQPTAKATSAPAPPTPAKRKGTLSFGPATTKKQAVESTKPKAAEKKSAPVSKPAVDNKKRVTQMKKKNNDHDGIEKKMAKTTLKATDIFSSDEEEDEHEEEKQASEVDQEAEPLEIEDEDDVMEEVEETKESENSEKEEDDETVDIPSPEAVAPTPPGKVKRKVTKKRTTRNARGLLVTEEVTEWETVDAIDVEETKPTPPKPKAASSTSKSTSNKSANAKKPAGQQTNLFSFFKKN